MMVATLKNGRQLLYPKSRDAELQKGLESQQLFVMIEGVRINKYEVSTMEDLRPEYDVFIGLSEDIRNALKARIERYKNNIGSWPTRAWKLRIIDKLIKAEKEEKYS